MKKKTKPSQVILIIVLFIIALIQIFPLFWLIEFSLKSNAEIFSTNPLGLPKAFRWSNYTQALFSGGLLNYFINSVFYVTVTIVVAGLLSSMSAYAIARLNWKLNGFSYTFFALGIMIPLQAVLLPLFLVLNHLKLLNTYWALLIPYITFAIPMSIMILCGFYTSIPRDIEEAAFMDGCNIYQVFFRIILPIVKPAIATVSIFTFLGTWNELMFANTFVNSAHYRTLPVGIYSFAGEFSTNWGVIGAGMVIATIPTLIIYFFLSDQVQSSIVVGAVKG
ncbi:binding-protein-dependent transport system inner membrane protein [[Clostridium] cellulosi]|jgi:Binding-protein-dependent transport system inner membrane component.|uniref:Binding-protein-dependent transport system inner membrane protein n=1 Tax=[Clostridium] cellulosi TaxID=29343 RepID=A0A078KJX8_9FIRM|nr:MAG: carbohydrate ABC transporter permease [[Clostridium] cellulosi]CDZ23946.1 binding-protein-dependent transport system inner membrane protein [[Clostridium] cellulosi]